MLKSELIIPIFYVGLIFYNTYECYKIQKKLFLSFFASFILVTTGFVYTFLWLWMFITLIPNPFNLTGCILYPLNTIIGIVVTIGGLFLCMPFSRLYDNFKDLGEFTFKKKVKK